MSVSDDIDKARKYQIDLIQKRVERGEFFNCTISSVSAELLYDLINEDAEIFQARWPEIFVKELSDYFKAMIDAKDHIAEQASINQAMYEKMARNGKLDG